MQKIKGGKSRKRSVAEEYGAKKNIISTWIGNNRKIFEASKLESEKVEEN